MVSVVVKVNIVKVLKSVTQWSVATLRRILEWAVAWFLCLISKKWKMYILWLIRQDGT